MAVNSMFSLAGKVILVTGGYGWLGKTISLGLEEAGAQVVVLGRNQDKFDRLLGDRPAITFVATDVSKTASIKNAYAKVSKRYNRIDCLINNAHYGMGGPIDALSDEAWQATMDGTVGNYHRCLREILPYFRKAGSGNIINVSSMYGMVAPDFAAYDKHEQFTNPPHYGAGKAATLQLTRYFAGLLGPENIRVNAISPGPFPSVAVQQEKAFMTELAKRTALNRIGNPEELQGAFIYLAGDASSYVTGQNLVVDGGWTLT